MFLIFCLILFLGLVLVLCFVVWLCCVVFGLLVVVCLGAGVGILVGPFGAFVVGGGEGVGL